MPNTEQQKLDEARERLRELEVSTANIRDYTRAAGSLTLDWVRGLAKFIRSEWSENAIVTCVAVKGFVHLTRTRWHGGCPFSAFGLVYLFFGGGFAVLTLEEPRSRRVPCGFRGFRVNGVRVFGKRALIGTPRELAMKGIS